jgi:predicted acyltransferase
VLKVGPIGTVPGAVAYDSAWQGGCRAPGMTGAAPAASRPIGPAVELVARDRPIRVVIGRRVRFVDASRGLAVVGMLVANLVNVCLRDIPSVLAHNQGDTLRAFDLPSPVFQFLVGVSLPLFLAERSRHQAATRRAAVRRFVELILLGVLLDGIGAMSVWPRWGVLQTLGLGGLVATAFATAPPGMLAAIVIGLLAVFSGFANGVVHASPAAALAFVPLTLGGLWLGRRIVEAVSPHRIGGEAVAFAVVAILLAAALSAAGIPFNKMTGTSSFVALSSGVAAAIIALAAWFEGSGREFPSWLLLVGRNALTAWVLLYVIVYYPAWLVFPEWSRLALAQGLVAVVVATGALCAVTIVLGQRGFRVRL